MLGPPKLRCLDRPIGRSIEELVPHNHFYRFLEATLDLTFVRTWVQDLYAERGRPSIDPVVFFRLQLIMFFEGIRSERQLMRVVADRLSLRWYLGYDLAEALPDHSSLTRIRTRLGPPIFQRFFAHVVELCQAAGLVWGKELFFDATKVRANADIDSLVPRWYAEAKAHLGDLFAGDPPADAVTSTPDGDEPTTIVQDAELGTTPAEHAATTETAPAPDDVVPCSLPFVGTPEAHQQLAEQNQAIWKLLDQHRLDPGRPPSCSYQRVTDLRVSTTDPDAVPMRAYPGDRAKLGYHDHYVVDGGRARIILAPFVTPADVMENTPMLDLLHRVRFRWQLLRAGGGGHDLRHGGEHPGAGGRGYPGVRAAAQL